MGKHPGLVEATAWASHTKRGTAVGPKCAACQAIAHAWPGLSWEALCAKNHTSEAFKAELQRARKVYQGRRPAFYPQDVFEDRILHVSLSKKYLWLPHAEFVRMHGTEIEPSDVGLVKEQVINECGILEAGYVISHQSPFKELEVCAVTGTGMQTKILKNEKQLRSEQGSDTLAWCHTKFETSQPKVLHSMASVDAPPTPEALAKRVEEAKARPKPAPEEKATKEQMQEPEPHMSADQLLDEVDSEGERLDPADLLKGSAVAASAKSAKSAGKTSSESKQGKRRGSGRREQQQQQQPAKRVFSAAGKQPASGSVSLSLPPPPLPLPSGTSEAGSRSRSPMSRSVCSSTSKASGAGDLLDQHRRYMTRIDLCRIVAGCKEGNEVNFARRVADALDKRSAGCAEAIELRARLQLAELAKKLQAETLTSVSRMERTEGLQARCPHMPAFPPRWAAALLLASIKDLVADAPTCSGDELAGYAERWAKMVFPGKPEPGDVDETTGNMSLTSDLLCQIGTSEHVSNQSPSLLS